MVPTPQRIRRPPPSIQRINSGETARGESSTSVPSVSAVFEGGGPLARRVSRKLRSWGRSSSDWQVDGRKRGRVLRRTWVENQGDHFQQLHSTFFEGLVDEGLLEKARRNAVEGINAYSTNERTERIRCSPHPSLKDHLEEAAAQLWKDAAKGRALICFDQGDHLLQGVISVPMARVPKMLPDRTVSDKGRIIWDATPINKTCNKERHPPALQPKHAEVARAILWWKQKFPGVPVLLSKKDVSDAFKWVPVRTPDSKLFAADLPGAAFGSEWPITILYNSLTFGWCGAPGEYMLYAWVAKQAFRGHRP